MRERRSAHGSSVERLVCGDPSGCVGTRQAAASGPDANITMAAMVPTHGTRPASPSPINSHHQSLTQILVSQLGKLRPGHPNGEGQF